MSDAFRELLGIPKSEVGKQTGSNRQEGRGRQLSKFPMLSGQRHHQSGSIAELGAEVLFHVLFAQIDQHATLDGHDDVPTAEALLGRQAIHHQVASPNRARWARRVGPASRQHVYAIRGICTTPNSFITEFGVVYGTILMRSCSSNHHQLRGAGHLIFRGNVTAMLV